MIAQFFIRVPEAKVSSGVRVLKLDGFAPVVVGAFWRGKRSEVTQAFLDELQERARRLLG